MKTTLVVEGEIFGDSGFRLAAVGVALEIDVLIFQRAPESRQERTARLAQSMTATR
jgi:hypothetical protein